MQGSAVKLLSIVWGEGLRAGGGLVQAAAKGLTRRTKMTVR